MSQLNSKGARALRVRTGKKLVDIAVSANVSPATVRAFEYGAPCRPEILARLQAAYAELRRSTKTTAA